jgi:hypothetical protein
MKFITAVIGSAVLASASASNLADNYVSLFDEFKTKFHKKYSTPEEESKRFAIFQDKMKKVDESNRINVENRGEDNVFGVTKFSDRSDDEFKSLLGRPKGERHSSKVTAVRSPADHITKGVKLTNHEAVNSVPSYVNWQATAMTPVKNQGQCGACWAFSAAEEIESQWMMNGNAPWEFSPQQIASCTPSPCRGCGGGFTQDAMDYIIGLASGSPSVGLGSAAFAPFIQSMTSTCTGSKCTESCSSIAVSSLKDDEFYTGPFAQVASFDYATPECPSSPGTCTSQNLTLLQQNLAIYGPASICVDASNWGSYTGGVMTSAACGGYAMDDIDHCT